MPSAVSHLHVATDPDGTAVASWQVEGDPVAVDVGAGPSPDRNSHRHVRTVPAGDHSTRLRPLGSGRMYVSVAPHGGGRAVVAADRRVSFEGLTNFRDLGGYRTADGSTVRWGLIFRADALHGLTAADMASYARLGVSAVYDLRGDSERAERPNPVPSRSIIVSSRPQDPPPPPRPGGTAADGEMLLQTIYLELLDHSATRIGELFAALAADGGTPAVFHCHAGKDRTGLVAGVLLEALGVGRETVLDDYELTSRYRLRAQQDSSYERLIETGLSPEAAAGVLTTPRWAMQAALASLDDDHGGPATWLTEVAGLRPGELAALRARLLAPPGS